MDPLTRLVYGQKYLAPVIFEDRVPKEPPDNLLIDQNIMSFKDAFFSPKAKSLKMKDLYDKEGFPCYPDGSFRAMSFHEMLAISENHRETAERLPSLLPKSPKSMRNKLRKLRRKNPPRKKVDIEQMFWEEEQRRQKMAKFD